MSLYLPTYMTPKNQSIDMTKDQIFSAQVNGIVITDYQLIIKNNDTNETLYDSTKLNLSTLLYDKDTLTHTVPANTITNGLNLKWTLTYFENANSVTSGEAFFTSYGTPTLTLTVPETVTAQSYAFVSTYSHPQNIGIKKFHYVLYDANGETLQDSGYFYSANLKYTFEGFSSGNTYSVECIVEDQNGIIISSGKQSFIISYSKPSLFVVPETTLLKDLSAVQIVWGKAVQVSGTVEGTSAYVNGFIQPSNKALLLDTDSTLTYDVDIPEEFNLKFKIHFTPLFSGVFCALGNDEYKIGYDGEKYYFDNKGTIVYGKPTPLPTEPIYVDVRPTDVFINGTRIGM